MLDALVELFGQGVCEPSTNNIADRVGISSRSLFRYFDDVDDLSRAAIERQLVAARPLLELHVEPGTPTAEKIAGLVEGRVRLFETIEPAARAARVCAHRNTVVKGQLRDGRSYLRHQLHQLFAPELQAAPAALLPALDALCSFEAYDLLRGDQTLSRSQTVSALIATLTALLDPSGGST